MASRKRPSKAAKKAAEALVAPSPEELAVRKLVARMTESIIQLEKTTRMLVEVMCPVSKRKYALSLLTKSAAQEDK